MPSTTHPSASHLSEAVLDAVAHVVDEHRDRLAAVSRRRISCEGWLKIELLHTLAAHEDLPDQVQVEAELDHVDLTLPGEDGSCLIELKTFPTNYLGGGGKPITNFIDGVVSDLDKLATKTDESDVGLAVWLAYPLSHPVPSRWADHLGKVEEASGATLMARRYDLEGEEWVGVYVMESPTGDTEP